MIIDRFGATYAAGQALGILKAEDDTSIKRSPVLVPVSGAGGAIDQWGDNPFPLDVANPTKKVTVSGASYTAVETALETLKANTIGAGRSKLWVTLRDGTTHRWAWAKCTAFERKEVAGAAAVTIETQLAFSLAEGLWYSETLRSANRTGAGNVSANNQGDEKALVRAVFAAGATNPGLAIGAGPPIFTWTGVTAGSGLTVNANTFQVTNNGADAYSGLSYGPGGSGQIEFFWLPPGNNTVVVTMTGSVQVTLYWYDTFS